MHMAEGLCFVCFASQSPVLAQTWPKALPVSEALQTATIVVQVNGKVRGKVTLSADQAVDAAAVRAAVLAADFGQRHVGQDARYVRWAVTALLPQPLTRFILTLSAASIANLILVPNKHLVNIVVK